VTIRVSRSVVRKAALPADERDPDSGHWEAQAGQVVYSALQWLAGTIPDDLGIGISITAWGQAIDWAEFSDRFTDVRDPLRKAIADGGRKEVSRLRSSPPQGVTTLEKALLTDEERDAFAIIDPFSVQWAEEAAGRLVVEVSEGVRTQIANLALEAVAGDLTGAQLARRLRDIIGLHSAWSAAVSKTYDREHAAALEAGKTALQAMAIAEKKTAAHAKALLNRRAWNIARTEVQRAQNVGKYSGWAQGVADGWIVPTSLKEWEEGREPCDTCKPLVGEIVRWDEPFSNGDLMPPDHPSCRCTANILPPDPEFLDLMAAQQAARAALDTPTT
jgi:hypothetical protein